MHKGLIVLGLGTLALLPVVLLTRPTAEKETKALPAPEPVTKEVSDEERRKIAAEWGRKGAAKSAEVRRAKKAARERAKMEAANAVTA